MKRITVIILFLFLIFSNYPDNVYAESKNYKAAILVEANTGKILYEHNKDEVLPQASITKLMTYYVIRDFLKQNSIENTVNVNVNIDMKKIPYDGSKINIKNDEVITIKELLESLLIVSANDSALQLETMFNQKTKINIISRMNEKAKEIGLNKSFYINTSGLTENNGKSFNYTTVYETAILATKIINDYPDVLEMTSKKEFVYKGIEYPNTNKILKVNSKVDGLKTGHTNIAGYCLVATEDLKTTNGNGQPFRLVSVVFGCKSESDRINETMSLLKFGEENFVNEKVIGKEAKFKLENQYYKNGFVEGTTNKDVYILKEKSEKLVSTIIFDENLPRNILKGDRIGKLTIKSLKDDVKYEYTLYSSNDFKSVSFIKRLFIYIKQLLSKG